MMDESKWRFWREVECRVFGWKGWHGAALGVKLFDGMMGRVE